MSQDELINSVTNCTPEDVKFILNLWNSFNMDKLKGQIEINNKSQNEIIHQIYTKILKQYNVNPSNNDVNMFINGTKSKLVVNGKIINNYNDLIN